MVAGLAPMRAANSSTVSFFLSFLMFGPVGLKDFGAVLDLASLSLAVEDVGGLGVADRAQAAVAHGLGLVRQVGWRRGCVGFGEIKSQSSGRGQTDGRHGPAAQQ